MLDVALSSYSCLIKQCLDFTPLCFRKLVELLNVVLQIAPLKQKRSSGFLVFGALDNEINQRRNGAEEEKFHLMWFLVCDWQLRLSVGRANDVMVPSSGFLTNDLKSGVPNMRFRLRSVVRKGGSLCCVAGMPGYCSLSSCRRLATSVVSD
ncbi:hypothetical protein PSEUDO8Z_170202 [Pseudomonas sp. 8Z]|nr:hypothetical protein PSEUDO8Z_170202 [Pseudomonas sp. 8Z]